MIRYFISDCTLVTTRIDPGVCKMTEEAYSRIEEAELYILVICIEAWDRVRLQADWILK